MHAFGSRQEFVDSSDVSWLEYARLCEVSGISLIVKVSRLSFPTWPGGWVSLCEVLDRAHVV